MAHCFLKDRDERVKSLDPADKPREVGIGDEVGVTDEMGAIESVIGPIIDVMCFDVPRLVREILGFCSVMRGLDPVKDVIITHLRPVFASVKPVGKARFSRYC